jgi:hypothetical protein
MNFTGVLEFQPHELREVEGQYYIIDSKRKTFSTCFGVSKDSLQLVKISIPGLAATFRLVDRDHYRITRPSLLAERSLLSANTRCGLIQISASHLSRTEGLGCGMPYQ